MAQTMPVTFDIPGERAIISYDWVDVAEGLGYVTYYAFTSLDDLGSDKILTTSQPRSATIETTHAGTGVNFTASGNFDTSPFISPRTIKGTAIITYSMKWEAAHINDDGSTTATLFKWDGSTATSLGTATRTWGNTADEGIYNITFTFNVTETHLKIGEMLRLYVDVKVTGDTSAVGKEATFGNDPQDRDGTYITPSTSGYTTQLKAEIPFKIDL